MRHFSERKQKKSLNKKLVREKEKERESAEVMAKKSVSKSDKIQVY